METTDTQASVMTVKDWIITLVITMIPLVGLVMIFVWAFGAGHNPNKSNWAKAALIVGVIVVALYIVFFVAFLGMIGSSMQ